MRAGASCGFASLAKGFCLGLLAVNLALQQAAAADDAAQLSRLSRPSSAPEGSAQEGEAAPSTIETQAVAAHPPKRANFELERASHEARHVADWVVDSVDNRSLPFAIVDKTDAKVFVFDADGRLRGAAPALLGLARGDDAVPGIGDRKLSSIRPEERTTPAGRFVAHWAAISTERKFSELDPGSATHKRLFILSFHDVGITRAHSMCLAVNSGK